MAEKGSLSVNTEGLLPIIKKWLQIWLGWI